MLIDDAIDEFLFFLFWDTQSYPAQSMSDINCVRRGGVSL